ncbi:MAG: hypothetical protein ICV83_21730 [Cytophagales bacterium]|nr:hypothetical protein [Cytophagales bacterium]
MRKYLKIGIDYQNRFFDIDAPLHALLAHFIECAKAEGDFTPGLGLLIITSHQPDVWQEKYPLRVHPAGTIPRSISSHRKR